jgi:ribokinase
VFVEKLGGDSNAEMALSLLSESSCELNVSRLNEESTGLAIIMLDKHGENSIVVCPGANQLWTETDEDIKGFLEGAEIVVLQLEIPIDFVKRVLIIARKMKVKTVFNPSPVCEEILEFLPYVDLLLVNKSEAEYFTGMEAQATADYKERIESLGVSEAVVTLGAGDTYAGALVARLSQGYGLESSAEYAGYASATAVYRLGAQPSIPVQAEVGLMIARNP